LAVGHKILIAVYFILKNKEPYLPPALTPSPKQKQKMINNFRIKIKELEAEINART
jgi:transposase